MTNKLKVKSKKRIQELESRSRNLEWEFTVYGKIKKKLTSFLLILDWGLKTGDLKAGGHSPPYIMRAEPSLRFIFVGFVV